MTIRVALADVTPSQVTALEAALAAEPDLHVVDVSTDGRATVEATQRTPVDLVVMDVRMPGMDGVEATRLLAATADRPYVIVLTSIDGDPLVLSAARAGVRGFVAKGAPPQQLITTIRTVHEGGTVFAPPTDPEVREAIEEVRESTTGVLSNLVERLTNSELTIFALIARGRTDAEIADQLAIGETAVMIQVGRLLLKLQCRDRVALVVLARAAGLVP